MRLSMAVNYSQRFHKIKLLKKESFPREMANQSNFILSIFFDQETPAFN